MQDIDQAIKRLPQDVVDARNQRLKRASDISLKKEYMAPELQAVQTPYLSYMQVQPEPSEPKQVTGQDWVAGAQRKILATGYRRLSMHMFMPSSIRVHPHAGRSIRGRPLSMLQTKKH